MKIENAKQLRELYGHPSGRASKKVFTSLDVHTTKFIEASPFIVLSTCGDDGNMDSSPRGGANSFVHILDSKTILIPDAKGNNRIDSLINIVETGRVSTLFFIPGVDETLRINGSAYISNKIDFLEKFTTEKTPTKTCIVVEIEEVFLHCAKAFMRARLWDPSTQINRDDFPTMGKMLKDQLGISGPIESQEEMVVRYKKDL